MSIGPAVHGSSTCTFALRNLHKSPGGRVEAASRLPLACGSRPRHDPRRLVQVSCGWPRAATAPDLRAPAGTQLLGRPRRRCIFSRVLHGRGTGAGAPRAGQTSARHPQNVLKIDQNVFPGRKTTAIVLKIGQSVFLGRGLRAPGARGRPAGARRPPMKPQVGRGGVIFSARKAARGGPVRRRRGAEIAPPGDTLCPIFSTTTPFRLPENTLWPIFSTFPRSRRSPEGAPPSPGRPRRGRIHPRRSLGQNPRSLEGGVAENAPPGPEAPPSP